MRVSAKGRYGLAAMIELAWLGNEQRHVPVAQLAENLGISKIYLEQIFALLKRGGLVISVKGAQGGYKLSRRPQEISVCDILSASEQILFEPTEDSVSDKAPSVETVMQEDVFAPLNEAIVASLEKIRLSDLVDDYLARKNENNYMFYI